MANSFEDLKDMIAKIVLDTVIYNVPRIGEVAKIEDPLSKGRILVLIPMLGWDTEDLGAWCYPKNDNGITFPKTGDNVLVEFIDGNRDYPIWSGIATQMKDMLPKSYTDHTNQILFENAAQDFSVRYDESNELLSIGEATESYVKGDTTKTELQKNIDALTQLQTDFTNWIPVPNDGGAALKALLTPGFLTKTLASLTDMLSERIKGE